MSLLTCPNCLKLVNISDYNQHNEECVKDIKSTLTPAHVEAWEEFKISGLFWFVNRLIQVFGWSIFYAADTETGVILYVYPARTKYRGFGQDDETDGFIKLTSFMHQNHNDLLKEVLSDE